MNQKNPRIAPLEPPYEAEIATALTRWMPPSSSVEPLKLFRMLYHNREISDRMRPLGAGILARHSTIEPHEREIIIDRVCARCNCEYEWGVHVASYGVALAIPQEQLEATVTGSSNTPLWSERQALLVGLVDELHDTAIASEKLWIKLSDHWSNSQLRELLAIVGWYHLISFIANATHLELEDWGARFPAHE